VPRSAERDVRLGSFALVFGSGPARPVRCAARGPLILSRPVGNAHRSRGCGSCGLSPDAGTVADEERRRTGRQQSVEDRACRSNCRESSRQPWLARFRGVGAGRRGSMAGSWDLVRPPLLGALRRAEPSLAGLAVRRAAHPEDTALIGAAVLRGAVDEANRGGNLERGKRRRAWPEAPEERRDSPTGTAERHHGEPPMRCGFAHLGNNSAERSFEVRAYGSEAPGPRLAGRRGGRRRERSARKPRLGPSSRTRDGGRPLPAAVSTAVTSDVRGQVLAADRTEAVCRGPVAEIRGQRSRRAAPVVRERGRRVAR
jgi:hypothetical protein